MENVKAYYRKAAAQKAMRKYDEALQSAEQGRKHAANVRQQVSHNQSQSLSQSLYSLRCNFLTVKNTLLKNVKQETVLTKLKMPYRVVMWSILKSRGNIE